MYGGNQFPLEQQGPGDGAVEINLFDQEEIHTNCTVQVWRNSKTGEESVGWWENGKSGPYQH